MKMTGMTANSGNLSAVNCDANFVKTISSQYGLSRNVELPTERRREQ